MFESARLLLEAKAAELLTCFACPDCTEAPETTLPALCEKRHAGCGYRGWQEAMLNLIENDIGQEVFHRLQQVEAYRQTFDCHMCGMCCRMASSEFSYAELQNRAGAGDDFARQFVSVFLPYPSRDEAREKYPDVVNAVLAEAGEKPGDPETIHFYHCPYIGEDNRCTLYGKEKRPAICSRYPETPLSFVYEKCSWRPWKDETHTEALMAHATVELCLDTAVRLKTVLK